MKIYKSLWALMMLPGILFSSWYDQKLEGWYYFEDPKSSSEKTSLTKEDAEIFLQQTSREIKQLLSLAILSPTEEHLFNYIKAQRTLVHQSNKFAEGWGRILLEHPELGDFLTTPTSSYGILAKKSIDIQKRKELLHRLSKEYFLAFFFKGTDPLSQKAAEVLQLFALTNGWQYKAISMDGVGNPQLDTFELDKGISDLFVVRSTPSFFIVNPTKMHIYPVGAGLISMSEIEQNIEMQIKELDNEL